jgi:serine-type D-Ala-D-Ala carboxypeptidase (penicillin-binding protein 5/6)
MNIRCTLFSAVLTLFALHLSAESVGGVVHTGGLPDGYAPAPPELQYAGAAALLDYETGTLLFGYNHKESWAPASLTKLMTIYTAIDAMEAGRFDLDTPRPVNPVAWASAMAPGSSLMFLGPDQLVSGRDLFRGLMISSGNDAATEVAVRVSGSVADFAREMNATAEEMGYPRFYFEEPAGLSPANRITAGEFAEFTARLITRHPDILTDYASLPSFTYPEAQHYPDGRLLGGSIRQFNRNSLLEQYDGADGLKTGFIEESGYNLAATAYRDGRRLIAVVLGVDASSHVQGSHRRSVDAEALLDWGFRSYRRVAFSPPPMEPLVLWGGKDETVTPVVENLQDVSLPADVVDRVDRTVQQTEEIWAPLPPGTVVGTVTYSVDGHRVAQGEVVLPEGAEKGSFFRRLFHRIRWWGRRLVSVFQGAVQTGFADNTPKVEKVTHAMGGHPFLQIGQVASHQLG